MRECSSASCFCAQQLITRYFSPLPWSGPHQLVSSHHRQLSLSFCICRVGIVPSSVEVRFENLHIQAKVFVGARALPSVLNSYRNFFEVSVILL